MAYNIEWRPHEPELCKLKAEERARRWRGADAAPFGFLYRFEDVTYSSVDGWEDIHSRQVVELEAIPIRSITPKGWTIEASNGVGWRFIGKEHNKRYALPTVEEAQASFIARKEKQAAIYEARAAKARRAIKLLTGEPLFTGAQQCVT